MKKYILTTIICMISLLSFADNTALYLRLDSVPCVGKVSSCRIPVFVCPRHF